MKNFETMKRLIGSTVKKEDLASVDCYVCQNLGIFVPATGPCGYAARAHHTHPAYMITIWFGENGEKVSHVGYMSEAEFEEFVAKNI